MIHEDEQLDSASALAVSLGNGKKEFVCNFSNKHVCFVFIFFLYFGFLWFFPCWFIEVFDVILLQKPTSDMLSEVFVLASFKKNRSQTNPRFVGIAYLFVYFVLELNYVFL